jgi:hypothetical protein
MEGRAGNRNDIIKIPRDAYALPTFETTMSSLYGMKLDIGGHGPTLSEIHSRIEISSDSSNCKVLLGES